MTWRSPRSSATVSALLALVLVCTVLPTVPADAEGGTQAETVAPADRILWERVSVAEGAAQATDWSGHGDIDATGSRIVFDTFATELGSNGSMPTVVMAERTADGWGVPRPVGYDPDGGVLHGWHGAISSDGRRIAYAAPDPGAVGHSYSDVVVIRDPDAASGGRMVAVGGAVEALDLADDQGVALVVGAFDPDASTYARTLVYATPTGETREVAVLPSGGPTLHPAISADGARIAYPAFTETGTDGAGEPIGTWTVDVYETATGTVSPVATVLTGTSPYLAVGDLDWTDDGRLAHVVYDETGAPQLALTDAGAGTTRTIALDGTAADGLAFAPGPDDVAVSADGTRFVYTATFETQPGVDTVRVYLYDDTTGITRLLSHDPDGNPATDPMAAPYSDGSYRVVDSSASISGDGSTVVLASDLSTLVNDDSNGQTDVFAATVGSPTTTRVWAPGAGVRAMEVTETSVTLSWDAATDVAGYVVRADGLEVARGPETTATIDGLAPGTAVRFTVRGLLADGTESGDSLSVTSTTATPPGEPVDPDIRLARITRGSVGTLRPGEELALEVWADAGSTVTVRLTGTSWWSDGDAVLDAPRTVTADVPLPPAFEGASAYESTFAIPSAWASVEGGVVTVDGPDGGTVEQPADGDPLGVVEAELAASLGAVDGQPTLTWTWPTDLAGLTGATVERRIGTADFAPIVTVAVDDEPTLRDPAPAGQRVDYRLLLADGAGAAAPWSRVATVTTLALFVGRPEVTRTGTSQLLAVGEELAISVTGTAGRQVTMTLDGASWYDEADILRDVEQPYAHEARLTEGPAGTYTGRFTVPVGLARLEAGTATVTDGYGTSVEAPWHSSLPGVGASLTVDIADTGYLDDAELTTWTWRGSTVTPIAGPGSHTFEDLPPTWTTYASIRDVDGRQLASGQTRLRAGLAASISLRPDAIRYLDVTLLDPDGVPTSGRVELGPLGDVWGTSVAYAYEGAATLELRDTDASSVRVRATPMGQPLWRVAVAEDVVLGGRATQTTLRFGRYEPSSVSGVATVDGVPAPGVQVRISQPERGHTATATSDGSGAYRLVAYPGPATVIGSVGGSRDVVVEREVGEAGAEGVDLAIETAQTYRIVPELWTDFVGADPFRQPVDWRTAYHFGHPEVASSVDQVRWLGQAEILLRGYPGEVIRFCADGAEAGLPAGCTEAILPASTDAPVSMRLTLAEAARVAGTLASADGSDITVWEATLYGPTGRVGRATGEGSELNVAAPELGRTVLDVRARVGGSWTRGRRTFEITEEGATTDIGEIHLGLMSRFLDASSSQVMALRTLVPAGTLVAHEAVVTSAFFADLSGVELEINPPAVGPLRVDGITVDGEPVSATVREDGTWVVPVGTVAPFTSRTVRFHVDTADVPDGTEIGAIVGVTGTAAGEPFASQLGKSTVLVGGVTLDGPGSTSQRTIAISGVAPAGADVEVREGASLLGVATATPGGTWRTTVTLPDRGATSHHRLRASTLAGGAELRSAELAIDLDVAEPEITRIAVAQPVPAGQADGEADGRRIVFDPREGIARFPYVWVPNRDVRVEVTFADPDSVTEVYVRIGSAEELADREGDLWVASLDAGGRGDVSVQYVRRAPYRELGSRDLSETELRRSLPPLLADAAADGEPVIDPDTGTMTVTGSFPGMVREPGDEASFTGSLTLERVPGYVESPEDISFREQHGYALYDYREEIQQLADGVVEITTTGIIEIPEDRMPDWALPGDGPEAGAAGPASLATLSVGAGTSLRAQGVIGKALTRFTRKMTVNVKNGLRKIGWDGEVGEMSWEDVKDTKETIDETFEAKDKYDDVGELWDTLASCTSELTRTKWQKKLERLNNSARNQDIATGFVTALELGAGPLGWVLDIVSEPITSYSDDAWDYNLTFEASQLANDCARDEKFDADAQAMCDDIRETRRFLGLPPYTGRDDFCRKYPERRPRGGRSVAAPVWIHDPSGIVYEGVLSNPMEGATATLLHATSPTGPWSVWDADWFGQQNPLATGADGRYAWDVPEGFWKVGWTKPGYLPATSAAVEVLPPHFDVHGGLLSTAAPRVEDVAVDATGVTVTFDRYVVAEPVETQGLVWVTDTAGAERTATVRATDAELAPPAGKGNVQPHAGERLARTFRLVPVSPAAGVALDVHVAATVEGYNGRLLGSAVRRAVTLPAATPAPVPAPGTGPAVDTVEQSVAPGSTVGTGDPSRELGPSDPITTTVTSPAAGTVSIDERAGGGPARAGYDLLGRHVRIEAPAAPAGSWLTIRFRLDGSLLGRASASSLVVMRDGEPVARCRGAGTTPVDPCAVIDRVAGSDDLVVEVRTTHASLWQFGVARASCSGLERAPFRDVDAGSTHASSIACAVLRGLANGVRPGVYDPKAPVTRAQAAAFIARLVTAAGGRLPATTVRFADVPAGHTHVRAIEGLAAAGVLRGVGGDRFAPGATLTRGQMATLLANAVAYVSGSPLPHGVDAFVDDDGTTHERDIDRVAAAGIARGKTSAWFDPRGRVSRDQMATFLVETLRVTEARTG